jgi:hypothetical protein
MQDNQELQASGVNTTRLGWSKLVAAIFVCLLPVVIMWGLFRVNRSQLSDFHLIFSDEIDYYAESVSISRNGILNQEGGYFGYNLDQHAKLLNYGAHAPFNLLPYAFVAKLTLASQYSALMANVALLCISLFVFFLLRRSLKDLALLFLLLFSFLPFLLYYFTGMVEVLIYAGLILLLPVYESLFEKKERSPALVAYILLVLLWSLSRLTHIFFLLPALLSEIGILKKKTLPTLIKYALIVFGLTVLLWLLSASFPWSFMGQWLRSSQKFSFFFRHGLSMSFKFLLPGFGEPMEVALRYFYLLWTGTLLFLSLKHRKMASDSERFFILGHLTVLVAHLVFVLFFYDFDEMRGFRMLAPILFFSMASCLLSAYHTLPKRFVRLTILVVWLCFLVIAFPLRQALYTETVLRRLEPVHKSQIFKWAVYNPNPRDRWENTIFVDLFIYPDMDYAYFTPGLGMMVFRVDELDNILAKSSIEALKAKYLISSAAVEFPGYEKVGTDMDISLYQKANP